MPKLRAFGTNLGSSVGRGGRKAARASSRAVLMSAIEPLENRLLMSRTFFVATRGNDASAGSLAAPFRTIQRAASIAQSGDTVLIEGGTYRETVHPYHGGVTFQNYNGQSVTVSGADVVGGWSGGGGAFYRGSMPWSMGTGSDQVFVDGRAVNEARWPNTSTDLSHPSQAYFSGVSGGGGRVTIHAAGLSAGWAGATIHFDAGNEWYAQTGYVTASGPGWLTFSYSPDGAYLAPTNGNPFYLTGKFQGLDAPGEWYRDNGGNLYLRTPGSDSPSRHLVEAQRRKYAFDLSGDPNTTIRGINIFAASVKSDAGSRNMVLDHINAQYISRFTTQAIGWQQPYDSGIQLNAPNSVIENSTIAYSSGDGVYASSWAPGSRIINNVIHDVDENGGDSAPIRSFAANITISHNTVYNAARCGIIIRAAGAQVMSNTIHDVMLQDTDGGGVYTIHQNGGGSQIAYNTIYNVRAGGYGANGIFLDDYSSNFSIHDNSIFNTNAAVKLNYTSRGHRVYNNALAGSTGSVVGNGRGDWSGTVISNNTLYSPIYWPGGGASMYGNRYAGGSPRPLATSGASVVPPPAPVLEPPAVTPDPAPVSQPGAIQAEAYSAARGVVATATALTHDDNGDWAQYKGVNFGAGVSKLQANVAVAPQYAGQRIQLRADSLSGPVIGTLTVTATGSWNDYQVETTNVSHLTGKHDVYLVFVGRWGIANVDWFKFA